MAATDCLFCKLVARDIKADIVYEDEHLLAFRDIHPQAPIHILVIPKQHIATLNDAIDEHASLLGRMMLAAQAIARDMGVSENGYRLVMNCNRDGGQAVFHIHLHLLAGRSLHWPPG